MRAMPPKLSDYERQRLRELHRLMDENEQVDRRERMRRQRELERSDRANRQKLAEQQRELERAERDNRREANQPQRRKPGPKDRIPAVKRCSPVPDDPA